MARRFSENTLHTGKIAYLHARGLVELDFPVLVRPMDEHYNYVVARYPVVDEAGLFYRVWEPTRNMQMLATDTFGDWYAGRPRRFEDDRYIWEAIRRIHRMASFTYPDVRDRGRQVMKRVAQHLSQQAGESVPPVSLAPVAEFYHWMGGLVFPHHMTASFGAATLLLMLGVPRERVAVLGMYYQDPTYYYRQGSDWRAGFMSGTPYYTVMAVFLGERWVALDFTVLARTPREQMPAEPRPHLRQPQIGSHPHDGAPLVIDYEHPYTMVFAPAGNRGNSNSPLFARIPLIETFR